MLQVQQKVGVPERTLASLSKFVRPAMPEQHREFFQRQAVLYVAVRDLAGSLLAGMLVGTRGTAPSGLRLSAAGESMLLDPRM